MNHLIRRVWSHALVMVVMLSSSAQAQRYVDELPIAEQDTHTIEHYWLKMAEDGLSQPIYVPVIVAKGNKATPVVGIAAAIHGNELNGIKVIQEVMSDIDVHTMSGVIVAIPGLNALSVQNHERRFTDHSDLNRLFPGKKNGNRSQQYVYHIKTKFLDHIDYLIDMHTASFGRENSLYIRGYMENDTILKMMELQDADILLNSKGPSVGGSAKFARTMRSQAMLMGIPAITVEYGNPQVYDPTMISRGVTGIKNTLNWTGVSNGEITQVPAPIICSKSYWIYIDKGGYLEVPVQLNQQVDQGDTIGIVRDPFGTIIRQYTAPQNGIVIGRSSNPINMSGGRIIHLGITKN